MPDVIHSPSRSDYDGENDDEYRMCMFKNLTISQEAVQSEAVQFLHREGRKQDPNIVLYRDNPSRRIATILSGNTFN
jgi:hypothetical protein